MAADGLQESDALSDGVVSPAGLILTVTGKMRNRFEGIAHHLWVVGKFSPDEVSLALAGAAQHAKGNPPYQRHHQQKRRDFREISQL